MYGFVHICDYLLLVAFFVFEAWLFCGISCFGFFFETAAFKNLVHLNVKVGSRIVKELDLRTLRMLNRLSTSVLKVSVSSVSSTCSMALTLKLHFLNSAR